MAKTIAFDSKFWLMAQCSIQFNLKWKKTLFVHHYWQLHS